MEADIAAGQFLEHQHVHGNIYGTSLMAAAQVAMEGKVRGWGVLLVVGMRLWSWSWFAMWLGVIQK